MALTNAERVANWRKRQREDPEKYRQYQLKEKERYKKKKEAGIVKQAKDMSPRELRYARKHWMKNQRRKRRQDKKIQEDMRQVLSPPPTPSPDRGQDQNQVIEEIHQNEPIEENQRRETMRKLGRKKVRKDRAKAYRELFHLRIRLQQEARLKEKYKKRYNRLKSQKIEKDPIKASTTRILKQKEQWRALLLHNIISKQIKEKYAKIKDQKIRNLISSLICHDNILMKYKLGNYASSVLGISRRSLHAKEEPTRKAQVKPKRLMNLVKEYLERDDNSRVKAGKKATITRRKEKKQLRLLNDSLKNIHAKFLVEEKIKISYSKFCALKPFWIVKASEKDRNTCLCKVHENCNYKLERLYKEGKVRSQSAEEVVKEVVCDDESKKCMYRECDTCKNKVVEIEGEGHDQVSWFVWKNRKIEREKNIGGEIIKTSSMMTVKEKESHTIDTLKDELNKEMNRVCRHIFNIRHQYRTLRYLRQELTHEEIIVHIDFSENYNCKYNKEIQSIHFGASQRQISIHTGVAYTSGSCIPFSTVSDNLKHGPSGIWAHLNPILKYLKDTTQTSIIHFISDGPTTQYRCKNNFYLLSKKVFDLGFKYATWNFMEAGHGKGAPDGIGAAIKRQADEVVNVTQKDITCAADLVQGLTSQKSSIKIVEIPDTAFDEMEKELPQSIKPVPETMKIHQIVIPERYVVLSRCLSCFCEKTGTCNCFDMQLTSYKRVVSPDNARGDEDGTSSSLVDINNNKNETDVSSESCPMVQTTKSPVTVINKPEVIDESLISKWCVVIYDGLPYPGIVQDVDDNELEVKTMNKIGRNRYYWPMMEDSLWYPQEKLVTLLDEEPTFVTKRHQQINPVIWTEIEKLMGI